MPGLNLKLRVTDRHVQAAAKAAQALEQLGNGPDAQLALALACMYVCMAFRVRSGHLISLIKQNLLLLGRHATVHDVLNGMHAHISRKRIVLPDQGAPISITHET